MAFENDGMGVIDVLRQEVYDKSDAISYELSHFLPQNYSLDSNAYEVQVLKPDAINVNELKALAFNNITKNNTRHYKFPKYGREYDRIYVPRKKDISVYRHFLGYAPLWYLNVGLFESTINGLFLGSSGNLWNFSISCSICSHEFPASDVELCEGNRIVCPRCIHSEVLMERGQLRDERQKIR